MIRFVLKWVVYLIALAAVGLLVYTYAGPFFGADFNPDQGEIRVPVDLDVD